jgi:hypothetical protein
VAQIDVADILSDPDFVSEVILIDRVPFVNSKGENTIKEVQLKTIGCVQPATGKVLTRLPEALRSADISSFWMKGTIQANTPGKYTSILVYHGRRYQVQTVFNWKNYGEGYTEGICVAQVPA